MAWVSSSKFKLRARWPMTRLPLPSWPWTPPGLGHPLSPWATCSSKVFVIILQPSISDMLQHYVWCSHQLRLPWVSDSFWCQILLILLLSHFKPGLSPTLILNSSSMRYFSLPDNLVPGCDQYVQRLQALADQKPSCDYICYITKTTGSHLH